MGSEEGGASLPTEVDGIDRSVGSGGEGWLGGDWVELGLWRSDADRVVCGYRCVEEIEVVTGVVLHASMVAGRRLVAAGKLGGDDAASRRREKERGASKRERRRELGWVK